MIFTPKLYICNNLLTFFLFWAFSHTYNNEFGISQKKRFFLESTIKVPFNVISRENNRRFLFLVSKKLMRRAGARNSYVASRLAIP